MEIKKNRYMISYNGGVVYVSADSIEEATERFKELRIETCKDEISIVKSQDLYEKYLNLKNTKT